MTKKNYDKLLERQEKRLKEKESELLEFFCDMCHHPFAAGGQDALDELCARCPVDGLIRALVTEAKAYGTVSACREISGSCEELALGERL